MKKLTLLVIAATGVTTLIAQSNITKQASSTVIPCSEFRETIPLRDMPAQTEAQRKMSAENHEKMEAARDLRRPMYRNFKKQAEQADPARQETMGIKALTAPLVNFDGQVDNASCPGDPNGAVGPTQYVQAINSSYQVYDKTGKSLTSVIDLATLFPGTDDDGDPVVLYDKFADRWFVSEFNVMTSPVEYLVAISKTGDATGSYYTYKFTNSAWTPGQNGNWIDYPKYSIWSDGYYMTGQISPEFVMVMDRAKMIAGKSSAKMIMTNTPTPPTYFAGSNSLYTAAKTLDCDASALPPYGTPEFLVYFSNTNSGGYSNMISFMKCVIFSRTR